MATVSVPPCNCCGKPAEDELSLQLKTKQICVVNLCSKCAQAVVVTAQKQNGSPTYELRKIAEQLNNTYTMNKKGTGVQFMAIITKRVCDVCGDTATQEPLDNKFDLSMSSQRDPIDLCNECAHLVLHTTINRTVDDAKELMETVRTLHARQNKNIKDYVVTTS